MIVHFIGSKSRIKEEVQYYRAIVSAIKGLGHEIARDWVEEINDLAKDGKLKKEAETWSEVDKNNAAAIAKADVIIVEGTAKSFFSGYQVAQAASQKKPILILTRDKSAVAISGLSTPTGFVKSVAYNLDNVESILDEFLQENTIETRDLRFNFYLDRATYTYLRWMSAKTGKTKAQVIRSMLEREMNKTDE
ncbi:MAG TPA: hypothetical protein VLF59_04320 [Candidatus Saccharimonadales bacterium]|nr:hypothetical protein [Candidatus Saccharimonadales bacterium]